MTSRKVPYSYRSPLQWPSGWKRTDQPGRSPFRVEARVAMAHLLEELARLGARDVVIYTNQRANKDGTLSLSRQTIFDRGVAVNFTRKGVPTVLACDQFDEIHDNIRAIGRTIESMRAIERYGASDMMDRAFTAFAALPAPEQWWQVLDVKPDASEREINAAYRDKMADVQARGADEWEYARLNVARDNGREAARGR